MIIDCAVHPVLEDERLATAIGPPWNLADLPVPSLFGDQYAPSFSQLVDSLERVSTPSAVAAELFTQRGVNAAVLAPSTRGYFPNPQQAAAFARAANTLVHDEWLELPEAAGRFRGSIRVAVNDPAVAVREIELWAADSRFVQVVVPLRVLAPYGDERYFPIWRAAAECGLPIFVHDDLATLIEPAPTPVGFPRSFAEYHSLRPMTGVVHFASLITSGVFGRLPDLRFVFGDVGIDLARALLLRVDKDWRSGRIEIPWVTELPSSFVHDHARFITQPEDDIDESRHPNETLLAEMISRTVFGSRYPYWDGVDASTAFSEWPAEARRRVLADNALEFNPRLERSIAALGGSSANATA